jgi:hypothetical protein
MSKSFVQHIANKVKSPSVVHQLICCILVDRTRIQKNMAIDYIGIRS